MWPLWRFRKNEVQRRSGCT